MSEQIAVVSASLPRRIFGLAVLLGLGGVVLYVAFARPPQDLSWRAFLVIFGVVVLVLAEKMRRATEGQVVLTTEGLFDDTGRSLAPLGDISGIERGYFAMKPSNGFVVRLSKAHGRAWAPGLWWRLGRRVGVGGVTAASQSKAMADALAAMIAERDGQV